MAALSEAIIASGAVVLFLDSETVKSTWVVKELETARDNRVPIITVIDQDLYNMRDLVDQHLALGMNYIFDVQVLEQHT